MAFIKKSISFCLLLFITATAAYAQGGQQMMQPPKAANPDSVTDVELQKFSNVTDSAQSIQQDVQSKVQELVSDQGIEFSRFRDIMMSQQNPQAAGSLEATQQEKEALKQLQPQLMQINRQAQQEFVQLIREQGLTPQRFQELMRGIQTNDELQQRLESVQGDT